MKPVLKFLCILPLVIILYQDLCSQNPFKPPSRPGGPYSPRRMILLERKDRPVLLKISEQYIIHGTVYRDSSIHPVNARIRRIRGDSIYLDSDGYRFSDLESFDLPSFNKFFRSDSVKWRVFFPPESIYHDRMAYSSYMRKMASQVRKDKITNVSGRSFHNILKINITKVVNAEIAFDYEHRFSRHWSVEAEVGYQFASGNRMGDDFFLGLIPLYKYRGINVVAGPKFYFGRIAYLQVAAIYHHLEMDLARTRIFNADEHYGLQYQYRNDLGGALRVGILSRAFGSVVIDSYAGIGVKICWISQFIYGSYLYDDSRNYFNWYNADHSPDQNHLTLIMPVISLGVKIGVGF